MIQLPPDFLDLLQAFADAKVEYLLVGGYAVLISLADLKQNKQASGRPRDLDDLQNLP